MRNLSVLECYESIECSTSLGLTIDKVLLAIKFYNKPEFFLGFLRFKKLFYKYFSVCILYFIQHIIKDKIVYAKYQTKALKIYIKTLQTNHTK